MSQTARKFRKNFNVIKEKITWYPGHMSQSLRQMQAKMRKIDCIIEVHDSRIPFSGRNPAFLHSLIGQKPHILVLNKKDLSSEKIHGVIKNKCAEDGIDNVVFTNCLLQNCKGLESLIPLAVDLIRGDVNIPREDLFYRLMVVGVPNVGKSSLINALRNFTLAKGKANRVGAEPGVTRSIQTEVKICSNPLMYLVDTPGILAPDIRDVESGMKLALCACVKDSIVGIEKIADFLLYWMNKTENFEYVSKFNLREPVDDVALLLLRIAIDHNYVRKSKNIVNNSIETVPNLESAAYYFVSTFRKGKLGDLCLDRNHLKKYL